MSLGSWRVGLRIAARTAWRAKGRTVLVALMVGLPVTGVAAADTLFRTAQLTPEQEVDRQVGRADFFVSDAMRGWAYLGLESVKVDRKARAAGGGMSALRAAGADPRPFQQLGALPLGAMGKDGMVGAYLADVDDPAFRERFRLRSGRAPAAPDEVAVTPSMAEAEAMDVGDVIVVGGRDVQVVGVVLDAGYTQLQSLFAPPDSVLVAKGKGSAEDRIWLVDAPQGTSRDDFVETLEASGLAWLDRDRLVARASAIADSTTEPDAIGTGVVVAGLAMLQIALLAGAAFAVGTRRQRRDLGLVAAQGGDRRQVRTVVLASGVVIGLGASIVGVVLGVAVAAVVRAPLEGLTTELFGPFEVAPLDLLVIIALGTVTAVLAAALPARTASRLPVLVALGGRRGVTRTPVRITVAGVALVVVGTAFAWRSAQPPASFNGILGGAVVAELGFVLCTPALMGLCGLAARWLPLSPRLALRDAARNRGRSAPAVAAVMAGLAATVGLSLFAASVEHDDREQFERWRAFPPGVALVETGSPVSDRAAEAARRAAGEVSGAEVARLDVLGHACGSGRFDAYTVGDGTCTEEVFVRLPFRGGDGNFGERWSEVAVGGPGLLRALVGTEDADARRALESGTAVTLGPYPDDELTVVVRGEDGRSRTPLPAHNVEGKPYEGLPAVVVSPAVAERLGVGSTAVSHVLRAADEISGTERERAIEAARDVVGDAWLSTSYFEGDYGLILLGLLGASLVVAVGASAIATALAGAESEADLATLAAVGASPGVRRRLAMSQAGVVALVGAVLGVLAGSVPAVAVLQTREDYEVIVPWATLTAMVVLAPLLAAVLAGLFTRRRLPMAGRLR